ncbi:MAG: single-stranded DNA-binding protein [Corynebacterium sp.]|nr:single-stranded DNA-binding protein [Corynebacterium sp.]
MSKNLFTIVGSLGTEPVLRRVGEDKTPVTNFRLCSSRRYFNVETSDWEEKDKVWVTAEVWGPMAERVASCLNVGMQVIATGTIRTEEYTDENGSKRISVRYRVANIAPDTKYYMVKTYVPAQELGGETPEGYVEFQPKEPPTKSKATKVVNASPAKGVA